MAEIIQTCCLGCGHKVQAPVAHAGRSAKCPKCGASIAIPGEVVPPAHPLPPSKPAKKKGRGGVPVWAVVTAGVGGLLVGIAGGSLAGGVAERTREQIRQLEAESVEARGSAAGSQREILRLESELSDLQDAHVGLQQKLGKLTTTIDASRYFGHGEGVADLMAADNQNGRDRLAGLSPLEAVAVGASARRIGAGLGTAWDKQLIELFIGPIELTQQHDLGKIPAATPEWMAVIDPDEKMANWPVAVRPMVEQSGSIKLKTAFLDAPK